LPRHPPRACDHLHPLAPQYAARAGRDRPLSAPPPRDPVPRGHGNRGPAVARRGLSARALLLHRRRLERRAGPRGAGLGLSPAPRLRDRASLVLLASPPPAARLAGGLRVLPPRAGVAVSGAATPEDPEPARGRDGPLARASPLRDARAVHRVAHLPPAGLLRRGAPHRSRPPGTQPGGVGVLLPV